MNYHHDPALAARIVHMAYCPIEGKVDLGKIAIRMGISPAGGSGSEMLEEIGRRVLANPADIPAFEAALAELLNKK